MKTAAQMNQREFIALVKEMREWQRKYFAAPKLSQEKRDAYRESKWREKLADQWLNLHTECTEGMFG